MLLLIGCLGLLIRAHEMSTDLAALAGVALAVAGLAHALKKPWAGGALKIGVGTGIAFLGDGLMPALLVVGLAIALPAASPAWRTRAMAQAGALALLIAIPLVLAWPLALLRETPALGATWLAKALATRWSEGASLAAFTDTGYFIRILPWYGWPALPLAAWTLWRARRHLAARADLHLPLAGVAIFLFLLSTLAESREVNAMPLLVPLVLLGTAELDSLPRGAASALDWFGVTTFSLLAILLWACFAAVMTGSPAAAAAWIAQRSPATSARSASSPSRWPRCSPASWSWWSRGPCAPRAGRWSTGARASPCSGCSP